MIEKPKTTHIIKQIKKIKKNDFLSIENYNELIQYEK